MTERPKYAIKENIDVQGDGVITFSLSREPHPALRNKLRNLIESYGLQGSGTAQLAGPLTERQLNELHQRFLQVLQEDQSGARLVNFSVWFNITKLYSMEWVGAPWDWDDEQDEVDKAA